MKYLVMGLESSCTRIVSKIIAYNLGIIDELGSWDGHENVSNGVHSVFHRSLPHAERDNYIDPKFTEKFDHVIAVTRDWNCSLKSKNINHHPDIVEAEKEHFRGISAMKYIMESRSVFIFSYETAFLLQESYTIPFLKSIGIKNPVHIEFKNVNEKYMVS